MSFTDEAEVTLGPFSPSLISLQTQIIIIIIVIVIIVIHHSPSEYRQVLCEPVPVLGQQVPLDAVHEVLEPRHHGAPLVGRLRGDNLVSQILKKVKINYLS